MKFGLICILFLWISGGMLAQEISFGAKGGVNFANFGGDDADEINTESLTGFHLGLLALWKFSEKFAFQPEVLYSSQGAKVSESFFDEDFGNMNVDVKLKLDYISVPLMLKFFPIEGLSLELGPQLSFLVDSEAEADVQGENFSVDIKDETNSFDFSGAVGLSYNLPMGLFFQGRYIMGFTDVYEDSDIRNRVLQLSIGYKF
ncbi:porin family protein [Salegentibacter sp. HM20]